MAQAAAHLIAVATIFAAALMLLMAKPRMANERAEHRRLAPYHFLTFGPEGPMLGDMGEPLLFDSQDAAEDYKREYLRELRGRHE